MEIPIVPLETPISSCWKRAILYNSPKYILPVQGPKVIRANRPGSTKRLNMLTVMVPGELPACSQGKTDRSIYLSIYLSTYPSVSPSVRPSIYLSNYLCLSLSVCLYLCLCLCVCLCVCLCRCLCLCLSLSLSLSLSLCLSVCLAVCLSACLPVCLSACLSLSVSLSVHIYIIIYIYIIQCVYIYIYIYISIYIYTHMVYICVVYRCDNGESTNKRTSKGHGVSWLLGWEWRQNQKHACWVCWLDQCKE